MKKLNLSCFLGALAILASVSCQKEEASPSLSIGENADVVVESPATSYTFTFTTNRDWTATSDADWAVLTQENGSEGDVDLVVNVKANNSSAMRYANITISVEGLNPETYTLAQRAVSIEKKDIRLGKGAEEFSVEVDSEADDVVVSAIDADWIEKGATSATAQNFKASANEGTFARSASFSVTNNGRITQYTVRQSGNTTDLATLNEVRYLGRTALVYDSESYAYGQFAEWALNFTDENGKTVVIVLNNKRGETALCPESRTYTLDAGGKHAESTFTVSANEEYTTFVQDYGAIIDGEVSLEQEGETYRMVATFYQAENDGIVYSYEGTVPETVDDSFAIQTEGSYVGQYATWFTPDQAKEYDVTLYFSENADSPNPYLVYMSLNFYADKNADASVIPDGTYTIVNRDSVAVLNITNPYTNASYVSGTYDYKPLQVTLSGNNDDYVNFTPTPGGTIKLTGEGNGKYTVAFDFEASMTFSHYDDDWNQIVDSTKTFRYTKEYSGVTLPETNSTTESKPVLDEGGTLGAPASNYSTPQWYGESLGTGTSTFLGGFMNLGGFGGSTIQFALSVPLADYSEYSRTAGFPDGEYKFALTPSTDSYCVVPVSNYSFIQNPYTGTRFYFKGGSITVKDGNISFNLDCITGYVSINADKTGYDFTSTGGEYHFSGSFSYVHARTTNRSGRKLYLIDTTK